MIFAQRNNTSSPSEQTTKWILHDLNFSISVCTPSQQELMNRAAELQNLHPNRNSWSDAQGEENRTQAKRAA